ncbi:hypothetical protein [Streptomyces albidoflavus]|uniref:hypothetical protein n=1 Tax=Streptomyces albidoflavus TaxID=1886 RepID=UPI0039FCE41B
MTRGGTNSPNPDPPVEQVGWADADRFVVGWVERPRGNRRPQAVLGAHAVRVLRGPLAERVHAPCAYVGESEDARRAAPGAAFTLFEDPGLQHLLCTVMAPDTDGRDLLYAVRDASGELVGTVRRVAGGPLSPHTWRIDQPGHPEVTGTGKLGSLKSPGKKLGASTGLAVDLVTRALTAQDGAKKQKKPRTLHWYAGEEKVMESEGSDTVSVRTDWLDRRLAFAFALIGDGPKPAKGASGS